MTRTTSMQQARRHLWNTALCNSWLKSCCPKRSSSWTVNMYETIKYTVYYNTPMATQHTFTLYCKIQMRQHTPNTTYRTACNMCQMSRHLSKFTKLLAQSTVLHFNYARSIPDRLQVNTRTCARTTVCRFKDRWYNKRKQHNYNGNRTIVQKLYR